MDKCGKCGTSFHHCLRSRHKCAQCPYQPRGCQLFIETSQLEAHIVRWIMVLFLYSQFALGFVFQALFSFFFYSDRSKPGICLSNKLILISFLYIVIIRPYVPNSLLDAVLRISAVKKRLKEMQWLPTRQMLDYILKKCMYEHIYIIYMCAIY